MKAISDLGELQAFLNEHPGRKCDLTTLTRQPDERLEEWVLSGKRILVPETAAEEREAATAMLGETVRGIGRRAGWKAAARHVLALGDRPPLTGQRLAAFAAYLRRVYA